MTQGYRLVYIKIMLELIIGIRGINTWKILPESLREIKSCYFFKKN